VTSSFKVNASAPVFRSFKHSTRSSSVKDDISKAAAYRLVDLAVNKVRIRTGVMFLGDSFVSVGANNS
jgi:hypothetical protein